MNDPNEVSPSGCHSGFPHKLNEHIQKALSKNITKKAKENFPHFCNLIPSSASTFFLCSDSKDFCLFLICDAAYLFKFDLDMCLSAYAIEIVWGQLKKFLN